MCVLAHNFKCNSECIHINMYYVPLCRFKSALEYNCAAAKRCKWLLTGVQCICGHHQLLSLANLKVFIFVCVFTASTQTAHSFRAKRNCHTFTHTLTPLFVNTNLLGFKTFVCAFLLCLWLLVAPTPCCCRWHAYVSNCEKSPICIIITNFSNSLVCGNGKIVLHR